MKRITTANREIDKFGPGKDGFRASVPGVSEATYLSADFFNDVQESIVRTIEAAGMVPSSDGDQLSNAVVKISSPENVKFKQAVAGAVERTLEDKLSERFTAKDLGAIGDGSADDLNALLLAKASTNRIHFQRVDDAATTYYIGAFTSGELDGLVISADEGVTLSFAVNGPYSYYKELVFASDVRAYFRDISRGYTFKKTPAIASKVMPVLPVPALKRSRMAIDCTDSTLVSYLSNDWSSDDNWTTVGGVTTTSKVATFPAGSTLLRGIFLGLGAYETASAYFDSGVTPGPIGIVIRGTLGFALIYGDSPTGNLTNASKLTGAAATIQSLPWAQLGQGSYATFDPDRSVWSVTRVDRDKAIVRLNGKAVTAPFALNVGDIYEVGFVCYTGQSFTVSALTVELRTDAIVGMPEMSEIRVFGDSTAETYPSSWDQYLKPLLDGYYGIRVASVTNYAVAGQDMNQQDTSMATNGFGDAYYVVVCAGTNNVQGGQSIADWQSIVQQMLTRITSTGRKPVIVIPWFWYGQAQVPSADGQAAMNYDKAAPYRMWLKRLAFESSAIVVDTTEELPNPAPSLLTSDPLAPYLRDNIHQDQQAHQLYAQAIAKAIADDYLSLPSSVEETPAAAIMANGATAGGDLRFTYGKDGTASLTGLLNVTTIADNTVTIMLPRHLQPTRNFSCPVVALSASLDVIGSCWIGVQSNGIVLQKVPATAASLLVNATWKTKASAI